MFNSIQYFVQPMNIQGVLMYMHTLNLLHSYLQYFLLNVHHIRGFNLVDIR